MSSIRLSERHGVNPAVEQCFVCLKDKGLVLFGRMKNDQKAPTKVCMDQEPCEECKDFMKQGIILISVDEKKSADPQNPWRTGGWVVVKEEFIRRVINSPDLVEDVCRRRMCFLPDEAWRMLGLPGLEEGESDARG
jgi:hypothetical protein